MPILEKSLFHFNIVPYHNLETEVLIYISVEEIFVFVFLVARISKRKRAQFSSIINIMAFITFRSHWLDWQSIKNQLHQYIIMPVETSTQNLAEI